MDLHEKYRFDFYLSRLKNNLPEEFIGTLPTLEETLAGKNQGAVLERIAALSKADITSRFYAAVLLKAGGANDLRQFAADAENDETPLRVQQSLGFGVFEMPLNLLTQDFLNGETVPGENFLKAEKLSQWASSVRAEKANTDPDFDPESLPQAAEIVAAGKDAEKKEELNRRIEQLTDGGIAERFYAAAASAYFDEEKSRRILESLLDESGKVGILSGDIMMTFPASEVAAKMLGLTDSGSQKQDFESPIARFFKWIGG